MTKDNKKKIVIPNEEEVAEYGQRNAGQSEENPAPDQEAMAAKEGEGESRDAGSEQPADMSEDALEWKDKYLRARAELANYQRRAEKDRNDALKYANAGLVKSLLPVIDDLERVLQQDASTGNGGENAEAIRNGVRLTLDNLIKVLQQFQVKVIESEGKEFDPAYHEAMMEQPSDEHPPRTVLQELSKGYRLHDRVLRPSKVIVSRASENRVDEETRALNGSEESTNQEGT